jgi:competence protein ComGC
MSATPVNVRTSPAAVWSLVLGILSIVLCLGLLAGIPAIICGIVAQGGIRKSAGALTGAGMAISGLILGSVGTLLSIFVVPMVVAITLPAVTTARQQAYTAASMNNAKQISVACQAYAMEHDGRIPESLNVLVKEGYLTADALRNPRDRESTEPGYRLVYQGRMQDAADSSTQPLVIEVTAGPRGRVVGFLDGHVDIVADGVAPDPDVSAPDVPEAAEARPEL